MKLLITLLFTGSLLFAACSSGIKSPQQDSGAVKADSPSGLSNATESKKTECKICDFDFAKYNGELSEAEINGLLLALNDEYLALATYQQINRDFDRPRPFAKIEQAEARHTERLMSIFKRYEMDIPNNEWTGTAPKFPSVAAACSAGVDGEIANRDLYSRLFKTTERQDILTVYRSLQRASEENHLPAFRRCGAGGRSR